MSRTVQKLELGPLPSLAMVTARRGSRGGVGGGGGGGGGGGAGGEFRGGQSGGDGANGGGAKLQLHKCFSDYAAKEMAKADQSKVLEELRGVVTKGGHTIILLLGVSPITTVSAPIVDRAAFWIPYDSPWHGHESSSHTASDSKIHSREYLNCPRWLRHF